MITFIRVARVELHGFFSSQAKGPLQLQAHAHVLVFYFVELLLGDVPGLALVGHKAPIRNAVVFIRFCNDILLVDLYGPPSYCGHAVLDRSDREGPFLPLLYQGLDVLRL